MPCIETEDVMKKMFLKLMKDESGASLIEYVLIAGLISIAGIVFMGFIGTNLNTTLGRVNTAVTPPP